MRGQPSGTNTFFSLHRHPEAQSCFRMVDRSNCFVGCEAIHPPKNGEFPANIRLIYLERFVFIYGYLYHWLEMQSLRPQTEEASNLQLLRTHQRTLPKNLSRKKLVALLEFLKEIGEDGAEGIHWFTAEGVQFNWITSSGNSRPSIAASLGIIICPAILWIWVILIIHQFLSTSWGVEDETVGI